MITAARVRQQLGLLPVVWLAACALSAPPADDTLRPVAATAAADDIEALTQQALAAARASPTDAGLQVAAAQRLFQAAELRMQQASVAWLRAHADATLAQVLAADDQADDDVRRAVVSLCTTGLECADRAAELAKDDVGARLHQALHLSLLAWANGPARALMAGYGPKLAKATDAAVALAAGHDGAAPLRLQGRFRSQAPWPYGDLPAAVQALQTAVQQAPSVVNHLFLGDALHKQGKRDDARAQWLAASTAKADESTRWSAELLREQARARLAARP